MLILSFIQNDFFFDHKIFGPESSLVSFWLKAEKAGFMKSPLIKLR